MVGLLTGWHSWLLYALLPLGWTAVLTAMAGRSATLQPKHKPVFKVGVRLKNTKTFNGTGNSKKDAQQKAATLLLKNIGM